MQPRLPGQSRWESSSSSGGSSAGLWPWCRRESSAQRLAGSSCQQLRVRGLLDRPQPPPRGCQEQPQQNLLRLGEQGGPLGLPLGARKGRCSGSRKTLSLGQSLVPSLANFPPSGLAPPLSPASGGPPASPSLEQPRPSVPPSLPERPGPSCRAPVH